MLLSISIYALRYEVPKRESVAPSQRPVNDTHSGITPSNVHTALQQGPCVGLGAIELYRRQASQPVISAHHVQQPFVRDHACRCGLWLVTIEAALEKQRVHGRTCWNNKRGLILVRTSLDSFITPTNRHFCGTCACWR